MSESVRSYLLVAAVATVALFTNLGGTRLWDRDETRNGECTREMLARGDWVTPYFNTEIRTHKPVLLYWFMMTAYAAFGQTEFAARFWSAAFGVGTCLLTCRMGRRLLSPSAGTWAGAMLATALWFTVASRAATPDSVLIFFATAALAVFVEGASWLPARRALNESRGQNASLRPLVVHDIPRATENQFPAPWPYVVGLYTMLGLAVLAKGPVGFVLPLAVIGMYLLIVRLPAPSDAAPGSRSYWARAWALMRPFHPIHFVKTCLAMRLPLGLVITLAVALPWYVWVGLRTDGAWLRGFFLEHNLGRATTSMEGHGYGPWFYPAAILACFFPWSIFALPTLLDAIAVLRRETEKRAAYIFLCCWVGVYVVLFSLAKTKLPSYVTPCYPALALLTAAYVERWIAGRAQVHAWWPRVSLASLALAGAALLVGLPLMAAKTLPGETWLGAVGLLPLLGAGVACWRLFRHERRAAALAVAATAVSFTLAVFAVIMPRVDRHQENHLLLEAIDAHSAAPQVASYDILEASWVFYGGRPVHEFTAEEVSSVAGYLRADSNHFVITTSDGYERLRPHLPENSAPLAQAPYFLKRKELVVLGHEAPGKQALRAASVNATERQ